MLPDFFHKNKTLLLFSTFQMFYQLSVYLVVPFFSLILSNASWSTEQITYFFALASAVIFLFGPVVGRLADDFGKIPLLITGLLLQAFFFIFYFFQIENITLVFIARVFEIIGFLCIGAVGLGAFEDLIQEKRGFWTGIFLSIGTVGMVLAPPAAGFVSENISERILFLLAAFATILALLLLLFIPQNKKEKSKKIKFHKSDLNPLVEIKNFLSHKKFQGMAILGILMNSAGQIISIFFPLLIVHELGFKESTLGLLLAIPIFMHLFQVYFGKISDHISAEFGVLLGVLITSSMLFLYPYVDTIYGFAFILFVQGTGSSIWNVSAWTLMGRIAKKQNMEAEVVGTYMSLAKFGVFLSLLISATLVAKLGIQSTIQLFAILILVGNLATYFFFKPIFHQKKKNEIIQHFKKI